MKTFLPASICIFTLLQSIQLIWEQNTLKLSHVEGSVQQARKESTLNYRSCSLELLCGSLLLYYLACCIMLFSKGCHLREKNAPFFVCHVAYVRLQSRCCLQCKYLCQWLQASGLQKTLLHKYGSFW